MNLATKAPNFTVENARAMSLRAVEAKRIKRNREKALLAAARNAPIADSDEARRVRVQKQIDSLLTDMEKAKTVKLRLQLASALDRLWKLVQPTAGVMKPGKSGPGRRTLTAPITQEPRPGTTTAP